MNVETIPLELRELPRWVVWRWGDVDPKTGKRRKPPYCPHDLRRHASSTKRTTWGTLEDAVALVDAGKADGIGFALEPPYVGVDLDDELPDGDRAAIVVALASYTETSPSGTGEHIVIKADLNGHGRHPEGIGVFTRARFLYFTGQHVTGTPTTIEERQAQLDEVLERFLPKPERANALTSSSAPELRNALHDLDDRALRDRAMAARNGNQFYALWNGYWEGHYHSQSEADLALCSMLAFWTRNDPARIDRMFRSSGLYREKWERDDYREKTIENALVERPYDPSERSWGSDAVDSEAFAEEQQGRNGVPESALEDSGTPDAGAPVGSENPRNGVDSEADSDSVDSDRIFALPIRDFIALEREHREPLLASEDGRAVVGARSLTLVGALGGQGKTTWAIDVFLHMAAGVDYPPWTVSRPVSILMIENEGPEELFAEKLRARLDHFPHDLKGRLDVCTFDWGGFSLADDAHRARLTEEIVEKGYDLVFGDPLDALGIEGVGSPEDTRKFLTLMKQTGLNKTVAWWLNTHPRKEETKDALNEISGAWGGKPDSVFLLRMLEDDRTQLRQPKLRWARRGKGPTLLMAFDPDTEAFTYVGEQAEDERDYLAEVLALLRDGTWRIVKEIAAPTEAGGIAAGEKTVKKVLEEHPDLFVSCTGDEAKALGRKPQATLWQLAGTDTPQTTLEDV